MPYKKIGSLWKQQSPAGKKYLNGTIKILDTDVKISIWPNDKGDNPKRPDYVITTKVEDEPRVDEPNDADETDPF